VGGQKIFSIKGFRGREEKLKQKKIQKMTIS